MNEESHEVSIIALCIPTIHCQEDGFQEGQGTREGGENDQR